MRRLQSLRQRLPGGELHHHGAAGGRRHGPAHRQAGVAGLRQLDAAPQQPDGEGGGGVATSPSSRPRRLRYRTNEARRPAGLLFGDAMPGDLTTRTATIGDIGVLVALNAFVQALHAEAHPDIFRRKPDPAPVSGWFAAAIADPNQRVWLAELDGNTAGYLVLRVIRRPPNPFKFADTYGLIDQIGIDPKARRRGLGRALIETARVLPARPGDHTDARRALGVQPAAPLPSFPARDSSRFASIATVRWIAEETCGRHSSCRRSHLVEETQTLHSPPLPRVHTGTLSSPPDSVRS